MTKKCLHIITGLGTGGAERSLLNLLNGPFGAAFEHSVISLTTFGTYGAQLRDIGVEVTALDIKRAPWRLGRLSGLLRRQRPDIVQGWMYHGNLAASFARPRTAQLLWNIRHGLEDLASEKRTVQWAIRANARLSVRPERVLFNAEVTCRQHIAAGFAKENTQVIPSGIDVGAFRFDPQLRADMRQRVGIPAAALVIGQLGRFHPVKDHENFLDAGLEILTDRNDVHLLLAGYGVEFETPFFRDRIPASLRSRVHLLGDRRDVSAVLSAMDIFVQASRAEGFPNALGEAMCTGRACVATDVGDSAFVLDDTGLIVPPRDSAALRMAIREFLDDPQARVLYGARARTRIEMCFPLDSTAQAYTTLYQSLF